MVQHGPAINHSPRAGARTHCPLRAAIRGTNPTQPARTARPAIRASAPDLSALDGPQVRTRPGRRRFIGRDLTSGSVPKNLWYLAWPQTVEGVFNALDQMADLFWAAKVAGFQAIGGVGVAQAFAHLIMMARMGLDVAMQSMVARAVGARQIDLASRIAIQSVVMTVLVSLVLMSVGIGLTSTLLSIVAVSDEVIAITVVYLQLQFVGTAVQGFRQSTGSALQASGDALTPMKATLLARGVHLALSPVMIFGWLGFPEMGIPGAAMANIVAQAVGAVWNIYALFTGTSAPTAESSRLLAGLRDHLAANQDCSPGVWHAALSGASPNWCSSAWSRRSATSRSRPTR